jgi:hypothetical protein
MMLILKQSGKICPIKNKRNAMQITQTNHITRTEWRWVTLVSLALLVLAFLPFLIVLLKSNGADWRFMGALHQYQNASAQLSRMTQGANGEWLVHFLHTPEPHKSALIEPIYALLGQFAGLTSISTVLVYHVARLVAGFIMYGAIYQLAASLFFKVRTRRIFFIMSSLGSGFGWLYAILTGETLIPDINIAQAFPFFATLVNVHYPLTIMCLAFLGAVLVPVLRVGYRQDPSVNNGGAVVVLAILALALLYPQPIVPFVVAMVVCIAWHWLKIRGFQPHESRWILWTIVPCLPIGAYYALTIIGNPTVAQWIVQQSSPFYNPILLFLGVAAPLLVGLPALWRGIRQFEADGDRFMLVWLVVMVIGYYLPVGMHETFLTGLTLPLAYFASRALEEVWLLRISRTMWRWVFSLGVWVMMISSLFVLFVPIVPFVHNEPIADGVALEPEYAVAFEWLSRYTNNDTGVLASPEVSPWIPLWTGAKTVYGHPIETILPMQKLASVRYWYRATTPQECQGLRGLQESPFGAYFIDYIIVGPRERLLGGATCAEQFELLASFGRVDIYFCDVACKIEEFTP